MPSCCPICYKVGLERSTDLQSRQGNDRNHEQLQQRFFRLLQRFILGRDGNNGKGHKLEFPLPFPFEELTKIGMLSCGECLQLMKSFCELYHQLKTVELLLNWKVGTLKNIMRGAQKVPSRMKYFRDCVEKLEVEESCNWGTSWDEIAASVIKSRKLLIQKCSRTMATSFPKLSVAKLRLSESKPDVMGTINSNEAIVDNNAREVPNVESVGVGDDEATTKLLTIAKTEVPEMSLTSSDSLVGEISPETDGLYGSTNVNVEQTTASKTCSMEEIIQKIDPASYQTRPDADHDKDNHANDDEAPIPIPNKIDEFDKTQPNTEVSSIGETGIDCSSEQLQIEEQTCTTPAIFHSNLIDGIDPDTDDASLNLAPDSSSSSNIKSERMNKLDSTSDNGTDVNELEFKTLQVSPEILYAEVFNAPVETPGPAAVTQPSRLRNVHPCTKCKRPFSNQCGLEEHQRSHESKDDENSSSSDSDFGDADLQIPLQREVSDWDDTHKLQTTASNQAKLETDGKLNDNDEVGFLLPNKLEDSMTRGREVVTDTCRDEDQNTEKVTAGEHPNEANEQCKFESVTVDQCELEEPPVPIPHKEVDDQNPLLPADGSAEVSTEPFQLPGSSTVTRSSSRLRTVHTCTKCRKTFSTQAKLVEHQRSHESEDEESSSSSGSDFIDDDLELSSESDGLNMEDNDAKDEEANSHPSLGSSNNAVISDKLKLKGSECTLAKGQRSMKIPNKTFVSNISKTKNRMRPFPGKKPRNTFHYCKVKSCDRKFDAKEAYEIHKKHHGQFSCSFCSVVKEYAPDLSWHEMTQHSDDAMKQVLEMKSKNKTRKVVFQCPRSYCPFSCGDKLDYIDHHLANHMGLKQSKSTLTCEICSAVFECRTFGSVLSKQLKHHFNLQHNFDNLTDKGLTIKCDQVECKAYFLTALQLRVHKLRIHGIKAKHQCSVCNVAYKTSDAFNKHQLKYHLEVLSKRCTHDGCDYRCETELQLKSHKQIHDSKRRQIPCPICEKPYWGEHGLNVHMKNHGSVARQPICELCGKAFKNRHVLDLHSLSHSGPESWEFVCSVCSKKCLTEQKLEEHMRTHTKAKPFVCEICGEKYAHRHNLRNHVNSKHGDVAQDLPKKVNRVNFTSRKGVKRKRASEII